MKYKVNISDNRFERLEKNDASLIVVKPFNHQIVLNKTGKQIFDMLNKYENSDEILNELKVIYPDVDDRLLNKDMTEMLNVFEVYNLIEFEDSSSSTIRNDENTRYRVTGDNNYKSVSDFILKALNDEKALKYVQSEHKEYYSPMSVRLRMVGNFEYGVFTEKNNKIQSYMTISATPAVFSSVISVSSLILDGNLTKEEVKSDINGMLNRLLHIISITKPFKKIRFNFHSNSNYDVFKEVIEDLGFSLECTLKDESEKGDLIMYTLCVS